MNKSEQSPEARAEAIRWGSILENCPNCGQCVVGFMFMRCPRWIEELPWPGFRNCGVEHCYCPGCDSLFDAWYRCKDDDYAEAEIDATQWSLDKETGRWNPQGGLFGEPRSLEAIDGMNKTALEKRGLMQWQRFERSLSGPRFVSLDGRFSVSIPLRGRTKDAVDKMLAKIKATLKAKRSGTLKKVETVDDVVWAHGSKVGGAGQVQILWLKGVLPADVSVWLYNNGQRFQDKSYDHDTGKAALHPSEKSPSTETPEGKRSKALSKNCTLEEACQWLASKLADIHATNEELLDTTIRDSLVHLLQANFIGNLKPIKVPTRLGLDDLNAEARLCRALKTFFSAAKPLAESRKLTPKQRKAFLLNNGDFFDELL